MEMVEGFGNTEAAALADFAREKQKITHSVEWGDQSTYGNFENGYKVVQRYTEIEEQ